jgi:hypothetical protein
MNLDDELRAALRREDPAPDFTQRVLARRVVARAKATPQSNQPIFRIAWAAAIAALLIIGLTATYEVRQMKAERASRDAVLALRIAADKLNSAREKVVRLEN